MYLHQLFSTIKTHVQDEEEKQRMYRMLRLVIRVRKELSLPNEFCALLIYRHEISEFLQKMDEFEKHDIDAFLDFFWTMDPRLEDKMAEKESRENNETILGVIGTGILTGLGILVFKLGAAWAWRTQYTTLAECASDLALHDVNATYA